jgi:hypothetical protein
MPRRERETEPVTSGGSSSWSDGLYPLSGGGSTDGSEAPPQELSGLPGLDSRGREGAVGQTPWFTPVEESTVNPECEGGICPVPWLTEAMRPIDGRPVTLPDNVNHPSHYTEGTIETIEAIEAALTPEEYRGYLKGNIFKYVWRERYKGGIESLKKARWYQERLIAFDEN